jgi:hypothetical protein
MSEQRTAPGWVENLLRPVLISGMMACLASPGLLLVEWLAPGWDGTYILIFAFFASLEGILSERLLQRRRISGWAYLGSRAAELTLLLILLKLANYLPRGPAALWADMQSWVSDPGSIVTNLDLFTAFLFAPLWIGSLSIARIAADLEVGGGNVEPPADRTSPEYYLWLTQPSPARDRQGQLDLLAELFLWGGLFLIVASSLIHAFLYSIQALAVPILLYFALGVALLSQARFSVVDAGWRMQGIPVQRAIGRRWLFWGVLLIAAVAVIALMLPTRYALGPIQAIWGAIGFLVRVLLAVLVLLYYLVASLFAFLLPNATPPERPQAPLQPFPAPEAMPQGTSLPWLEVLGSALFWLSVLGIVGYAIYRFVADRLDLLAGDGEAQQSWWGRLLLWLQQLWESWRSFQQEAQVRLARLWEERRQAPSLVERLWELRPLRQLSPRELIQYFYISVERRAAQSGQPRKPGQTPHEYEESLRGRYPELEPDLGDLTQAFVTARYSPKTVEEEEAKAVQPLWERVKAALRRARKGE